MTAETKWIEERVSTHCTICGGYRWSPLREGRDLLRPGGEVSFKLSRCTSCGHVMQTPLPTDAELQEAYSVDYAPYRPAWKEARWPLWKVLRHLTTQRRMMRLKRYGNGGKLLEVGSGAGDFLYAAHRAGWEVKAVEYSGRLADSLRIELGFDVRSGGLRPGLWKEGEFDVVALWNVLEHVRNPQDTVTAARSYLRAGGSLLLQIPTLDGIEREKWFGQYWALLDLPRHLNFFGRTSLAQLCDRAGMKLTAFETPFLDTAWCYFASGSNYAGQSKSCMQRLVRLALLAFMSIAALPYFAIQGWRRHGTVAFAVAVKR